MSKILVVYKDSGGMPRAWAVGSAEEIDAVRARAKDELTTYVARRREVGEPWVKEADFEKEEIPS